MISGKTVDTSVWIDFINTKTGEKSAMIREAIEIDQLVMIPIIMQEVLQGIRSESIFLKIKEVFLSYPIIKLDQAELAISAASLYRFLRNKGVTIRKPNDCIIAVTCIKQNLALIHNDKDFDNIAKYSSLKIHR